MRVLFLDKSPIWLNGLPYGFRDAGHEIRASGPLTEQNIPAVIKEFAPHLIVTVGWGTEQTKKKQDWIRRFVQSAGVPHVYWATEDPHFTQSFTLPLIMRMKPDLVFTPSMEMVHFYRKIGIRAAHLDFGFHPTLHRRVKPMESYRTSLALVANAYPNVLLEYPEHYRHQSLKNLIKPLVENEIPIHLWGRNWEEMKPFLGQDIPRESIRGYLTYPEAYKVYSSADIMIGLQNYRTQVTQRTYEILGSGGFLLTSDTPAVRRLFQPGRHLVVSSSPQETLSLVRYYLQHPEERKRIRAAGRAAVEKHSYKRRAEWMIEVLRKEGLCHG